MHWETHSFELLRFLLLFSILEIFYIHSKGFNRYTISLQWFYILPNCGISYFNLIYTYIYVK